MHIKWPELGGAGTISCIRAFWNSFHCWHSSLKEAPYSTRNRRQKINVVRKNETLSLFFFIVTAVSIHSFVGFSINFKTCLLCGIWELCSSNPLWGHLPPNGLLTRRPWGCFKLGAVSIIRPHWLAHPTGPYISIYSHLEGNFPRE